MKVDLSRRRGLPADSNGSSWETILIRLRRAQRTAEPDPLIDRLMERGVISIARRDIAGDIRAGKLAAPAGKWALLLKARGHGWLMLAPSWEDYDLAEDLATKADLSTLMAGYQDTAGSTFLQVFDGKRPRVQFSSTGFSSDYPIERGPEETEFKSDAHPFSWLKKFKDEAAAQQALLEELDAYVPYIGAYEEDGRVKFYASDDVEFDAGSFERIDLLVFGPAQAMTSGRSGAGRKLRKAIDDMDERRVREAIAAGADLRMLPESPHPPLQHALAGNTRNPARWLAVIRALLEGGADAGGPAGANPPICVLADETTIDQQALIKALGLLLDHGADASALSTDSLAHRGRTAVHILALMRGATPLKFLHSRGVNLFVKDSKKLTPLAFLERVHKQRSKHMATDGEEKTPWEEAIDYLRAVKAGNADDAGYQQAAAADRTKQAETRRDARRAFLNLTKSLEAMGKATRRPTRRNIADLIVFTLPDSIRLVSSRRLNWEKPEALAEDAKRLEEAGFELIGQFSIREFPGVRILATIHPTSNLYASVCEKDDARWIDVVRYHRSGTKVCASSARLDPAAQFSSRRQRNIFLPRAGLKKLIDALASVKVPKAGVQPITAEEFAKRYEQGYRDEVRERQG